MSLCVSVCDGVGDIWPSVSGWNNRPSVEHHSRDQQWRGVHTRRSWYELSASRLNFSLTITDVLTRFLVTLKHFYSLSFILGHCIFLTLFSDCL